MIPRVSLSSHVVLRIIRELDWKLVEKKTLSDESDFFGQCRKDKQLRVNPPEEVVEIFENLRLDLVSNFGGRFEFALLRASTLPYRLRCRVERKSGKSDIGKHLRHHPASDSDSTPI